MLVASFVIWFVVFVFSTTAHEAAHALVAYLGGDRTAYEGGQVSLDPLPHIKREPFGMVIIPIMTFLLSSGGYMIGFASAPFNPKWAQRHPSRYAGMSFAGPAANFLLALIGFALMTLFIRSGHLELRLPIGFDSIVKAPVGLEHGPWGAVAMALSVLFSLNLLLGLFNLIPLPPLDGAGVVEGLFPDSIGSLYRSLRSNPIFGLLSLLFVFNYGGRIISPILYKIIRAALSVMV